MGKQSFYLNYYRKHRQFSCLFSVWILTYFRNSHSICTAVAGKRGQKRNRQTVFWQQDMGRGWQSRERKLKELKQEGCIALGKWNSQWSHMQPYVGWALLFASVTCLQGYIRWVPTVLGAQPLDMSLLGLFQHNKCCFLLICLSVPYLS
jgi:hypothetical protein